MIITQEHLKKSAVMSHLFEMLEQKPDKKYRSPLDRLYKRMAGTLQKLSEPFLDAFKLQETPIMENLEPNAQEEVDQLRKRLTEQLSDIRKTILHANLSYPVELVENILTSAIINSNGKS